MQVDYSRIWPYVIAIPAVLLIYRRLRRSFGQQPVRPVRMWIRIGILTLLGFSFLPAAFKSIPFLAAEAGGLGAGIALALWGTSRTRYRSEFGQVYYVPHTYTGIAVSVLFLGRLAYRLAQPYAWNSDVDSTSGSTFAPPIIMSSPFTAALVFFLIGYYVCYYGMVLWKTSRLSPEELEVVPTPTITSP